MISKNNKICQLLWSIHNCDSTLREKRFQSDYSKGKAIELKKMKNIKNTISYIKKGNQLHIEVMHSTIAWTLLQCYMLARRHLTCDNDYTRSLRLLKQTNIHFKSKHTYSFIYVEYFLRCSVINIFLMLSDAFHDVLHITCFCNWMASFHFKGAKWDLDIFMHHLNQGKICQ